MELADRPRSVREPEEKLARLIAGARTVFEKDGYARTRIQEICRTELERFLKKSGPRSLDEQRELEQMVSRIAGKIAHPLITQLRSADRDPLQQAAYLDTIKRIFKLQKNSES